MSSSDDTNTYYQMIQYLLNTVDKKAVERCVNSVIEYVREKDQKPDELLNFHDNTNALGEECYKYDLYEKMDKYYCNGLAVAAPRQQLCG